MAFTILCYFVLQDKESWDMNTTEKIEAAGKKKEEGNALFKAGKYLRASKRYEKVKIVCRICMFGDCDFCLQLQLLIWMFVLQAAKLIEYDTSFSEEEKKQSKALKVTCNLNNAACKLKLKEYKQAEKLCTKVRIPHYDISLLEAKIFAR